MKIFNPFLLSAFVLVLISCSPLVIPKQKNHPAPTLVPRTSPEMDTAGFWISNHPFPDRKIMNRAQIAGLNAFIQNELKTVVPVLSLPNTFPGYQLRSWIESSFYYVKNQELYFSNGRKADDDFFSAYEKAIHSSGIPDTVVLKYGFLIKYTNQRLLPTSRRLYSDPQEKNFDRLQNSAYDLGTPVAVFSRSRDGKWLYVKTSLSAGWVPKENVALASRKNLTKVHDTDSFLVSNRRKSVIFKDPALTRYHGIVRMGNKLAVKNIGNSVAEVLIPEKDAEGQLRLISGFVDLSDFHRGYVPYTPRNIIRLAFEFLHTPYGWGGMYGQQDCSRFIRQIFAAAGIFLPRNSSAQGQVGILADQDGTLIEKRNALSKKAMGGITLIQLDGHIMLFLGKLDDRFYAIHGTWGYDEPAHHGNIFRVLNRVAVTDLLLGAGTEKKSYLERIENIRNLAPPHFTFK